MSTTAMAEVFTYPGEPVNQTDNRLIPVGRTPDTGCADPRCRPGRAAANEVDRQRRTPTREGLMNPNTPPPSAMVRLPAAARRAPRARLGVITTVAGLLITAAIAAGGTVLRTVPGTATLAAGASPVAVTDGDPVPVTVDSVHGAWYMPALADGSVIPLLARFSPDGTFTLGGIPDPASTIPNQDPWATGDFQARPTGITFHPTGGWCGASDNFAWHVTIDTTGRMQVVHLGSNGADRNKVGHCTVLLGTTYYLSRVSPQSPAGRTVHAKYLKPNRPITGTDQPALNGYWLIAGTGLLIQVTGTAYVMDDAGDLGAGALDAGTITVTNTGVRMVSGPTTTSCQVGTDLTVSDARIHDGQLQGTIATDQCHRGPTGTVALLHLTPSRR
jgi:hypothetical protein